MIMVLLLNTEFPIFLFYLFFGSFYFILLLFFGGGGVGITGSEEHHSGRAGEGVNEEGNGNEGDELLGDLCNSLEMALNVSESLVSTTSVKYVKGGIAKKRKKIFKNRQAIIERMSWEELEVIPSHARMFRLGSATHFSRRCSCM